MPTGANCSSIPSDFNSNNEVAAVPRTTSARGLSFSANNLAVITSVESRTQLMPTPGFAALKLAL
jgi:hypothetical protein